MTTEWGKDLMEALKKKFGEITGENILQQDPASKLWYLRSVFSVYPDHSANVMIQSIVFEIKPGVQQIEVIVNITNDVEPSAEEEVIRAVNELNYFSPVGAFGLRQGTNRLYLRNCWIVDEKEPLDMTVEKVVLYYTMMMEAVQGGYEGLQKVWTGELTFDQAVEEGFLNRAND